MKIGVLSDIHGNITALNAVIKHAQGLNVDAYFILGDLVGYYPKSGKVVRCIRNLSNTIVIQGNHERLLMEVVDGTTNIEKLNEKYGEGHEIALRELGVNELEWLRSLPVEKDIVVDDISIKLCHGAPGNPNLYLYPDTSQEILNKLCIENLDFIFIGHSHYPFVTSKNNCVLINVGSVGMSKDVGGLASWGVLDTSNRTYIPYRTPYNIDGVISEIINGENSNTDYLVSVLKRNRYDL